MGDTFPLWNELTVKQRMSKERKWNLIANAINSLLTEEGEPSGEPVVETPTTYDINITINDGTNAIQDATVVIGETTRTTGSAGGCSFTGLEAGTKSVTVTAEGYTEKTESISVDADHLAFTISLTAIPNYDVEITVNDGTNPIENASVVIGETTKTTADTGKCTFDDLVADEYSAEISATGYTTKTETLTVDETHTSFTISLEAVQEEQQQESNPE